MMIRTTKKVETSNDFLLPPDPERVMEGLRDTGYNFNTAISLIILLLLMQPGLIFP